MLSMIIDVIIKYKELLTKNSCKSKVYMSCKYRKIQEIE